MYRMRLYRQVFQTRQVSNKLNVLSSLLGAEFQTRKLEANYRPTWVPLVPYQHDRRHQAPPNPPPPSSGDLSHPMAVPEFRPQAASLLDHKPQAAPGVDAVPRAALTTTHTLRHRHREVTINQHSDVGDVVALMGVAHHSLLSN